MDELKKRKTHTSTAVKNRYNKKAYAQFNVRISHEDFEKIETLRASLGMSRAEFIKYLVDFRAEHLG